MSDRTSKPTPKRSRSIAYEGRILDVRLTGTLTALSPISIKQPDAPDDVAGVPQITVVTAGGPIVVPHVPGGTFKGLLRYHASRIAARHSSQEMRLPVYFVLHKGGIKQKGKESVQALLETVEFRNSNPVLGLFGASDPRWLGGAISVGPAYTLDENAYAKHTTRPVRVDSFRLDPSLLDAMPEEDVMEYAVRTQARRDAAEVERSIEALKRGYGPVKDDRQAVAAMREEEAELKKEHARLKGIAGVAIGMPLGAIHAIAPGSRFNQRIGVQRGRDDEVGLLVETIRSLSLGCRIGGMRGIGYGDFEAEWSVLVREDPTAPYEAGGTISVRQDEAVIDLPHPLMVAALEAWERRKADPDSFVIALPDPKAMDLDEEIAA